MSTKFYSRFVLLLGILWLTACSAEIDAAAVQEQVVAAVGATLTAVATPTAASTYTPYPTLTAVSTFTPAPTYTSQPTLTPQATYTDQPTLTPPPTATPTDTPSPTATSAPVVAAPVVPPPASSSDQRTVLLAKIELVLSTFSLYVGSIDPATFLGFSWRYDPTDCQQLVNLHETIANRLILTPPFSDATIESAYTRYQTSVDAIVTILNPYTDICRESIANGELTKFLGRSAISKPIISQTNDYINILNQAAHDLRN